MGARIRPFAVARRGGQWRGTSGTAAGCSGPSRPEALGRGPAGAPRFGAGRTEPPRAIASHPGRPFPREGEFTRTDRKKNQQNHQHRAFAGTVRDEIAGIRYTLAGVWVTRVGGLCGQNVWERVG